MIVLEHNLLLRDDLEDENTEMKWEYDFNECFSLLSIIWTKMSVCEFRIPSGNKGGLDIATV